MATINGVTISDTSAGMPKGTILVKWVGLANGDQGLGVKVCHFSDKTVQFFGNFGAGGIGIFEGSNDSTNGVDGTWSGLADPQGVAISKTSAAIETVLENPLWVRPSVTAGVGTAMNISLLAATVRQA